MFYSKEMKGWNTEDDVFFCALAFGSSVLNRTVECPAEDSAMVLTRGQHHSRLDMACVLNSRNIWHYLPMMRGSENQEVGGTLSLLHLISNLKDFGFLLLRPWARWVRGPSAKEGTLPPRKTTRVAFN